MNVGKEYKTGDAAVVLELDGARVAVDWSDNADREQATAAVAKLALLCNALDQPDVRRLLRAMKSDQKARGHLAGGPL
jgi:hypothetical protein